MILPKAAIVLAGLVSSAALLIGGAREEDTPSALEQAPSGWTDLLAGAGPELKGWTRGTIPPGGKLNPKSQWSLDKESGSLICEGNGGHEWLRWDQEAGDGVFHVEWKFIRVDNRTGYNSGIYARNSADATIWHQAQTGDASGGFLFGDSPRGGALKRFNLADQQRGGKRVKPAGQWNTFEITCKGKDMSLWVNGAITNEWHDCEVPKGYLGLEAEGWKIEFRNVKFKPL
jgi:hypothetical protein